jgi:aspartate kinase
MPVLKCAKFGGSSLADSRRFLHAAQIIRDDPARRVIVVSAPGKRFDGDAKITDLLCLCHTHLSCGVSCWDLFGRIRQRFTQIRDGCGLSTELDFEELYDSLSVSRDLAASRGEYLSAKLMADLLGYDFCDAARWLRFGHDGTVDFAASRRLLEELARNRPVVIPGFYGVDCHGAVKTFSRGGSDVTGALAAAALGCDWYENWTDVDGIWSADPRLTALAGPVRQLGYEQLQFLTAAGMQVLHPDAVSPVAAAEIPLQIRSTAFPDLPGTVISAGGETSGLAVAGGPWKGSAEASLLAAVYPSAWESGLFEALEAVNHVVLQRSGDRMRILVAPEDFAGAVEILHRAKNSR